MAMGEDQGSDAMQGAQAGSAFGPWGALIGAGAGLIGGQMASGDANHAKEIQTDLYNQYANLQIPDINKQRLALALQQSAGTLTPQAEQAQQLGSHDAYQDVAVDPRLRQAQTNNLDLLSKIANSGGLTDQDRAQLNAVRRQTEADTNARVQQQLQQQQARGVGTADASLAARMLQEQQGANRQAVSSDNEMSMAFQRALQAAQGAGSLGSQMEQQQYQQQANLANALNSREGTNLNQRANSGARNVAAFNQAQQYNLNNNQAIANNNTGIQNQEQQYNKGLYQQQYNNQLSKLGAQQGQAGATSNALNNSANQTRNQYVGAGEGIGKFLMANDIQKQNQQAKSDAAFDNEAKYFNTP